jgi:sulfur carrier protein ThiS
MYSITDSNHFHYLAQKGEKSYRRQSMLIAIEKTNEKKELEFSGTAAQLLEQLKINPVTVIVAADKKLVPFETDISHAKKIDILSIVSGG